MKKIKKCIKTIMNHAPETAPQHTLTKSPYEVPANKPDYQTTLIRDEKSAEKSRFLDDFPAAYEALHCMKDIYHK